VTAQASTAICWVAFDVGETIVDETRMWTEWAEILGVPVFHLAAALGAVIARAEHHTRVFDVLAPGVDRRELLAASGRLPPWRIEPDDIYPDTIGGLAALREAGIRVAIAGNQPRASEEALATIGIPFDLVATSESYGAPKPEPAFFDRLLADIGEPPAAVAYVGDRIDNDVLPAHAAGMRPVFLRRGPWAAIQSTMYELPPGTIVADSLLGLPSLLRPLAGATRGDG
jgi:FMN phosphatase YigB (HAD superfamily)